MLRITENQLKSSHTLDYFFNDWQNSEFVDENGWTKNKQSYCNAKKTRGSKIPEGNHVMMYGVLRVFKRRAEHPLTS